MSYDMRRSLSGERAYNVKTLNNRRHLILRYNLLGYTNKQIAEILTRDGINCTAQNVSDIVNSPLGQEHLIEMRERIEEEFVKEQRNIARELEQAVPEAFDNIKKAVVEGVVDGDIVDIKQRLDLSRYLMSCAGHSPIHRVDERVSHRHGIDKQTLDFIKEESSKYIRPKELVLDAVLVEKE